jgi:ParB family chromosome partitioning protein
MSVRSFAADAAEKAGLDERSIRRSVSVATKLCPKVKKLIRGTHVADKQANLLGLIKHTSEDQMFLVKAMLRSDAPASNLAAARAEMMGQVADKPKTQTDKLQNDWTRANAKERAAFLNWLIQSNQPIPSGFEVCEAKG